LNILFSGMVLHWNKRTEGSEYERLLWFDRSKNLAVVYNLSLGIDEKPRPLPVFIPLNDIEDALICGIASIQKSDPYTRTFSASSEFVEKYANARNLAWSRIKDMVLKEPDIFDEKMRSQMIGEIVEKYGHSKITIYRWLRKYWRYGKTPNSLLPLTKNCGAPGKKRVITPSMVEEAKKNGGKFPKRGKKRAITKEFPSIQGINLTTKDISNIHDAIKEHHLQPNEPPFSSTYRYLLRTYYNQNKSIGSPFLDPNGEYPSLGQMKYVYYRDFKREETIKRRKGINLYNQNYRPKLGTSVNDSLLGPGSIYQMDSTISDVVMVNSIHRGRKLQKATIYLVMDVFTRFITGFHVGFEKGWNGANRALFDSFVYAGKDRGSPVTNENCILPKVIVLDKGTEFVGLNSDHLAEAFEIEVKNVPAYRPELKGIVEQAFNMLKEKFRIIPGFEKNNYKQKGVIDPADNAILTISEFRSYVWNVIEDYNQNHYMENYSLSIPCLSENVNPYPQELWNWGIREKSGALRNAPMEWAIVNLLPKGEATITSNGIKFEDFFYSNNSAIREGWFVNSCSHIGKKVKVAYDYSDISIFYVISDNGDAIERCRLVDSQEGYSGKSMLEVNDSRLTQTIKRDQGRLKRNQTNANLDFKNDEIIANAFAMKNENEKYIPLNKAEQHRNKKGWTKLEGEIDQFNTSVSKHLNVIKNEVKIADFLDSNESVKPKRSQTQSIHEHLRKLRGKS
jgi:putative transposase